MTEQAESRSIKIEDVSNQQVAIFTFVDVTADELQNVLADFRRLLREMSSTAIANLASTSSTKRGPP